MFFCALIFMLPTLCFSLKSSGAFIRGSTKPLENFDPLGFSCRLENSKTININYLREAELKHGRIGMISATLFPLVESQTHTLSIHNYDNLPGNVQMFILGGVAAAELTTMLNGWKNPFENSFQLKEEYQPGDFGFATNYDFTQEKDALLLDKELNNGRLAMIASLGMIVQELVTGKSIVG